MNHLKEAPIAVSVPATVFAEKGRAYDVWTQGVYVFQYISSYKGLCQLSTGFEISMV